MVQPQPQPSQEAAPTDDVRSALNRSPSGQHLLMGEDVRAYNQPDSTTDGAMRAKVDGLHVKLQLYSRDLGKYVTYTGLLAPASSTTELKSAMADAGIIADGGATDLDLDGGDLTAHDMVSDGSLHLIDATTEATFECYVEARDALTVLGQLSADNATLALTAIGPVIFNSDLSVNGNTALVATTAYGVLRGAAGITWAGTLDGDPGATLFVTDAYVEGDLHQQGTNVGFYNNTPVARQTINGSRGGNAALTALLTALDSTGIIRNSTSV